MQWRALVRYCCPEHQRSAAMDVGIAVAKEAWRVERNYSRYRKDSIVSVIHRSRGSRIVLDDETASLIDFAQHCFKISDGMFDVTSGVLRAVWHFDGSDRLPKPAEVGVHSAADRVSKARVASTGIDGTAGNGIGLWWFRQGIRSRSCVRAARRDTHRTLLDKFWRRPAGQSSTPQRGMEDRHRAPGFPS